MPKYPFRLALLALVTMPALFAASVTVDSVAALQKSIDAAQPGDTITVKDGVYTTAHPLVVRCVGTAEKPITITAATVGGVEIAGAGGVAVEKPAAYVTIAGFTLTHEADHDFIGGGTSHVRFTRNTFHCAGKGVYLTVTGDDAEVDHNEFRDKATLGNMISVTGTGSQVARRLHVHHNYFHDFANAHGNGAETIRFGLSGLSMSRGEGLVEYNLFVRCCGENELISNKSCANTYRYNTLLDSPGAQLTLRHGNDCVVYGNIFRGTDGLRVFGDRHHIYSNYLEGNTRGINLGNGDGEVADGAKLTSHDRPDHCIIVFNTLVDNRATYEMDARKDGMGATDTIFANNLIQGGGVVAHLAGPHPGAHGGGNLLWQTGEAGDLPGEAFTKADPKLARDAAGLLRPQGGSPVIGAAEGEFPFVVVDLDGQPRPKAKLSIGADESSGATTVSHLLTPAEVGPSAK